MAFDTSIGDPTTPSGMRKHLVRRMTVLGARRSNFEPFWNEEARFCAPVSSRILSSYDGVATRDTGNTFRNYKAADTVNSKLLDPRAVRASEVLANGMHSGLTNPSRPWWKATLRDPELASYQPVKEYLDAREQRIYDLMARSNFYTTLKGGYLELGRYGTEAGFIERHWRYGMVVHPLRIGEYWLGLDDGLVPDSLYRRSDMTALQHYQRFYQAKTANGGNAATYLPRQVVEAYDKGDYDKLFPVYNAVEPNDLRDPKRADFRGMAFRSVYWSPICSEAERGVEEKALLLEEGFHTKPFWTSRWDAAGSDAYSLVCPGLNALADVRALQLQVLRKAQAADFALRPPLRGPATLNNVHAALQPGRITAMAGVDKDSFAPIWQIDVRLIEMLRNDVIDTRQMVDEGFYAHLFNAITNMPGVQPRNIEEIAKRNEEQLTQLGPVVERVNQEKLQASIIRVDEIIEMAGGYNDLEKPPELEGEQFQIEFISTLAQAQRLVGLGSIERVWGFATSIAEATGGQSLDSLDVDATMQEYGDITTVAAKVMRGKDAIDKIRADRAQQQQQAQAAEQAATLAPALKQGAETAQILYDSPGVGSAPSLAQRLLGTQ